MASLDFSFAGLKTAGAHAGKKLGPTFVRAIRADLAASTQAAIVERLLKKVPAGAENDRLQRLVVAGGVGPTGICARPERSLCQAWHPCTTRELHLCTDNGAP